MVPLYGASVCYGDIQGSDWLIPIISYTHLVPLRVPGGGGGKSQRPEVVAVRICFTFNRLL